VPAWCAGKSSTALNNPHNHLYLQIFSARFKVFGQRGRRCMAGQTVTRAQLSEAVYQEVGLSRNESAELVETVLNEISEALARGEMVKISSFGSFAVRKKGRRIGRNPKTGQEVPINPRRVLVFRASHVLKDHINASLSKNSGAS
jgi:integration host factor subunit alpha